MRWVTNTRWNLAMNQEVLTCFIPNYPVEIKYAKGHWCLWKAFGETGEASSLQEAQDIAKSRIVLHRMKA